jgi:hypothetical protein
VALAWSLTGDPSAWIMWFGPRTRKEEAIPMNITTRKALWEVNIGTKK